MDKIEQILKLAEIGFTKDEIIAMTTQGNKTDTPEPQGEIKSETEIKKNERESAKKEAENTNTENTENKKIDALMASVTALTKAIQASNIKSDVVNITDETTDDIVKQLLGGK